jgi:hypothetical protein
MMAEYPAANQNLTNSGPFVDCRSRTIERMGPIPQNIWLIQLQDYTSWGTDKTL